MDSCDPFSETGLNDISEGTSHCHTVCLKEEMTRCELSLIHGLYPMDLLDDRELGKSTVAKLVAKTSGEGECE